MCPERVTASLCAQIPTQVMRGVWRSQDWTPVPRPWGPAQPLPTGPSARRPLREPSLPVLSPASSASITDLGNSFLSLIRLCCLPLAPCPSPQERGDPRDGGGPAAGAGPTAAPCPGRYLSGLLRHQLICFRLAPSLPDQCFNLAVVLNDLFP